MEEDGRTYRNRPLLRLQRMADPLPLHGGTVDDMLAAAFTPDHVREIQESGQLPEMIAAARETERKMRHLRRWLESLDGDDDERRCECGAILRGRTDQRYCSTACRVRAHRAR